MALQKKLLALYFLPLQPWLLWTNLDHVDEDGIFRDDGTTG